MGRVQFNGDQQLIMRQALILSLAALVMGSLPMAASAAPRDTEPYAKLMGRNDGDVRVGLAVACNSSGWTSVAAFRAARRKIWLVNIGGGIICIGTGTMASGTACADSALGVELVTSATYDDSSEDALTCRTRAGAAVIKGFDLYDDRD